MKMKKRGWLDRPLASAPLQDLAAKRAKAVPRSNAPRLTAAELAEWVAKAKALPDLRWEKVQAIRETLRAADFDADGRVTELCRRLREEWPGLVPPTG